MTQPACAIPTLDAVRRLLSQLLSSGAPLVRSSAPFLPGPKAPAVAALYATDDGTVAGAWVSDVAFAAWAGAALTLIVGGQAQECIKRGVIDGMLYDNFSEIMNVGASLFNVEGSPHTRLVSVQQVPTEKLPEAAAKLLQKPAGRLDLEIEIPGYGTGRVAVMVR